LGVLGLEGLLNNFSKREENINESSLNAEKVDKWQPSVGDQARAGEMIMNLKKEKGV
jgi:hypothetical protein